MPLPPAMKKILLAVDVKSFVMTTPPD
jgi:hypothetical protein